MHKLPHILLVEDSEDHAALVRSVVESLDVNCALDWVADGEQALDFLMQRGEFESAERPGVVLLDVNLPRMDGFELLSAIRTDESLFTLPVVVFSTSSARKDIGQAYAFHANSYVVKPVGFSAWEETLSRTVKFWIECNWT